MNTIICWKLSTTSWFKDLSLSRNRIQMQYRKLYQSNRESKQWTCAMIVLVERYCITCIFFLSTSRNDIYMYTRETLLDSSIIDSDLDLFSLTNYLVRMMQAVSRQCILDRKCRQTVFAWKSRSCNRNHCRVIVWIVL